VRECVRVCMCVCVCMYVCAHVYVCMRVCAHMYEHILTLTTLVLSLVCTPPPPHPHTGVWHSGMCLGLAYHISAIDGGAASAQSALEATPTARRPRSNVLNALPNAVQMRQDDATTRT